MTDQPDTMDSTTDDSTASDSDAGVSEGPVRDTAQGDPEDLARTEPGHEVERGELVERTDAGGRDQDGDGDSGESERNSVTEPAKVMRIGSMVKQLLEEVRAAPLDEASRERLAEVYERSVVELSDALSTDLQDELKILTLPFNEDTIPSDSELRVAKAQLVGWLEGLFHGIQATLFAQQLAARQQLEQMRQLPPGASEPQSGMPGQQMPPQSDRPGTYL